MKCETEEGKGVKGGIKKKVLVHSQPFLVVMEWIK